MQMEKANKKSWMSLFAYARLELPEIAESLQTKQNDMEYLMKNFVNINGVQANKWDILYGGKCYEKE